MRTSPLMALSLLALTACEPTASLSAWEGASGARQSTCDGPLGPAAVLNVDQALKAPNSSGFEPIGDTPILDGTSAVIGGLYSVQFFELDASGTYQTTSFFQGPSGYAFGQSMSMDDGLTLVGEDNFQLPGQSNLTGRVRAYRRDATGHWALDPVTPYLNATDIGLQTATGSTQFGDVLEQEGNTLVVGAMRADSAGNTSKGVFTFTEDAGWQLHTVLPNVGNGPAAIRGDYIATADRNSGTIRVFKRTDGVWSDTPVATIAKPASGSSEYAKCNDCMAWDGDRLILGDIYANNQSGGAVVFERNAGSESFSLLQTVIPPGSGLNGFSLDASEDRLYVGSGSGNRLTVYTFDSGSGQYVQGTSLTGSAGYGRGVSVDGNRLLVGQSGGIGGSTASSDRAILYTGLDGVDGFCEDPEFGADPGPECVVGAPYDWDGDGEDDGCRGTTDDIDPSVVIPAGTQSGEGVMIDGGAMVGTGNVLRDGVVLARGAVLGDDNDLGVGTVIGRRAQIGSGNVLGEDTTVGRSAIIGDNNVIEGSIGYGAEVGSNVDLPDVTIGSLVTIGSPTTPEGAISCVGPLILARGAVVAPEPTDTFTCTGQVIIGPDSRVESAAMGSIVRLRKSATLRATVTLGDGVRVGRDATLEGGVELLDDTRVSATVRLCDDSGLSGRFPRAYIDPTCP